MHFIIYFLLLLISFSSRLVFMNISIILTVTSNIFFVYISDLIALLIFEPQPKEFHLFFWLSYGYM